MDKKKLQWHPAFYAVLKIELEQERHSLQFYVEYNLTRKPLQIDALIIKVEPGKTIQKNIGRIFRRYNIIEYKSMTDYMSVNDFFKVTAYACIFQSNTARVQEIQPTEVTLTLAGEHYPRKLTAFLKDTYHVDIKPAFPGIYHVHGLLFPMQLLVIRELQKDDNIWLSRLRSGLKLQEDIEVLAAAYSGKEKNPLYETAMDLIIRANWEKYQEVRNVCDALKELYAEELKEREDIGLENGFKKGESIKLITQVMNKMRKGQTASDIAEDLLEPLETVSGIYDFIVQTPGCNADMIYNAINQVDDALPAQ